jgi:hypothetical protein
MEPILVPGTPKEAFNKHRLMSDLVKKQVEHFKHVEEKLPQDVRASLPQHDVVTENDAARYIAAMTTYLLSRPAASPRIPKKAASTKRVVAMHARPALTLAAAAESPAPKRTASGIKAAAKKKKPAATKKIAATKKPAAKKSSSPKAGSSSRKRAK